MPNMLPNPGLFVGWGVGTISVAEGGGVEIEVVASVGEIEGVGTVVSD
ncbi:MAG: hypothetical protein LUP97_06050 [Methanoregula sp.]|nr:hypothetical protein [Methanoregula sp.]